jgi:hypothetical protein
VIGKLDVDLFFSKEKLHLNLENESKNMLKSVYIKEFKEHPGIFNFSIVNGKIVILHTNITSTFHRESVIDLLGTKQQLTMIDNTISKFSIVSE